MTPESESKLFAAAPLLYSELRRRSEPRLRYGLGYFECGDGWRSSLLALSAALEALIRVESDPPRYRAHQVKEKFGTLRFYMSETTDAMRSLICTAEQASATLCEDCGAAGSSGALVSLARTVCSVHAAERGRTRLMCGGSQRPLTHTVSERGVSINGVAPRR